MTRHDILPVFRSCSGPFLLKSQLQFSLLIFVWGGGGGVGGGYKFSTHNFRNVAWLFCTCISFIVNKANNYIEQIVIVLNISVNGMLCLLDFLGNLDSKENIDVFCCNIT